MARYVGNKCKLCRREGMKLFLKGQRCFTDKCAVSRRDYPPGVHAQKRTKVTDYGVHLREKQKLKRIYGILERPFTNDFAEAERMKGNTGENLMSLLERRLDNVVLACGFALSRNHARQLINHGHFTVNGERVNIPSYLVNAGDEILVREKSRKIAKINDALAKLDRSPLPQWIEIDRDNYRGKIKNIPQRSDISADVDEQLIVELYNK